MDIKAVGGIAFAIGVFISNFATVVSAFEFVINLVGDLFRRSENISRSELFPLNPRDIDQENIDVVVDEQYHPAKNVPTNLGRLTLDFNSRNTDEGRLKAEILRTTTGGNVTIVVTGPAGVGKTCALLGLGEDPQVNQRFPGGVFYFDLGEADANISTLSQHIRHIVDLTGGSGLARKLRSMPTFAQVVNHASGWFRNQKCLFLVDDIWMKNDFDLDVVRILCNLVQNDSCLVYSTKHLRFRQLFDRTIRFEQKSQSLSRKMLMIHSFTKEIPLSEENENAMKNILDLCGGNPLALGVAGGGVSREYDFRVTDRENALQDYWTKLADGRNEFLNLEHPGYGEVSRVVDGSLQVLSEGKDQHIFNDRFEALCVVPKHQEPPLNMLQNLWGLSDFDETYEVARKFHDVSIIRVRTDNRGTFFTLHDLFVDIATDRAGSKKLRYAKKLVENYKSNDMRTSQDWWRREDDGFLHRNLCRVLIDADSTRDLLILLSRPEWIVMRLENGGLAEVEKDLRRGMRIVEGLGKDIGSHWRHLKLLSQAARMADSFVTNNGREAWFQLYGRLVRHEDRCDKTRAFIAKIEKEAPLPFARPSIGFLEPAGGPLTDIINGYEPIWHTSLSENIVTFISGDLVLSTHDLQNGDMRPIPFSSWSPQEPTCIAYSPENRILARGTDKRFEARDAYTGNLLKRVDCPMLHCLSFSENGKIIASGSGDGKIRAWYTKTWRPAVNPFVAHRGTVRCISYSSNGSIMISGSEDCTVKVWDTRYGYDLLHILEGHTGWIRCVSISPNGRWIASGSNDKTLRVWDSSSGNPITEPLEDHEDIVRSVAFSPQNNRIVSGSHDNTVRVWDVKNGRFVSRSMAGHRSWVTCVAFSENGSQIVSTADDNTVRVWDANSRESEFSPPVGHSEFVSCVAESNDESIIVSGSWDSNLFVWDGTDGHLLSGPFTGHQNKVNCVAISMNSKRIVSGSEDTTMRIWNAQNGDPIGEVFLHDSPVSQVAIDETGSCVISKTSQSPVCKMWNVNSGEIITTSSDPSWKSEINIRSFNWSDARLVETMEVKSNDDNDTVLATLPDMKIQVGNLYFSKDFASCCQVISTR